MTRPRSTARAVAQPLAQPLVDGRWMTLALAAVAAALTVLVR